MSSNEHGLIKHINYNEGIQTTKEGLYGQKYFDGQHASGKRCCFSWRTPEYDKKLRQQFPKWVYVTDDQLRRLGTCKSSIVFYWTAHSSHKMMRYVYNKLPENANVIFVSATNIPLLITQMQHTYHEKTS